MKKILVMLMLFCFGTANAITVQELLGKIDANKNKVTTMEALMITNMDSPMMGGQPMQQKAKFFRKGDKTRTEISDPIKKTTITNGDKVFVIDENGQKMTMPSFMPKQGMGPKDPEDYLDKFDLTIEEKAGQYIVKGTAKNTDGADYFGMMILYINRNDYSATKMIITKKDGGPLMDSDMEYVNIQGLPVLKSINSVISMQMDKNSKPMEMKVNVVYEKIKINEAMPDSLFE